MRIFEFNATVAAPTGYASTEFVGTVNTAGDFLGDFAGDLVSDASLDAVVQPRGVKQIVAMELWIDGAMVSQQNLKDELSVSRDYDNIVQGWGFSTPLMTPAGTFGTPFGCIGPALGKKTVTVYGVYVTASGEIRIPLITGGIVDNAHREAGEGGIFETFSGVDRGGRYDGVKITKQFPPGHGLPRGRVGREIMASVGETQVNFEDGHRMDKELQLVDTEPFPTLAEIFEVENRKILWDSEGYVTNPQVGRVRTDEPIVFSFEERDLLRISTVSLDSAANVITLVVANGTKQKTKDACGVVWQTKTEFFYEAPYTPKTSLFRQNTDGTYDAVTAASPLTDPVLVKKIETKQAFRCDTLIEVVVKTWEMARTEVPRHSYEGGAAAGTQDGWRCLACYTDDNNGVGAGPAYLEERESFRLVSISRTKNFYIYQEYGGGSFTPSVTGNITWNNVLLLPPFSGYRDYEPTSNEAAAITQYGQAQGSVTFLSRWGHAEGSVKTRAIYPYPLAPWDEIEPTVGQKIWGNGTGVYSPGATSVHNEKFIVEQGVSNPADYDVLMPWGISCNAFYGDERNFQIQDDLYEYEWRAPRGQQFYYNENDSRSEQEQTFQLARKVVNTYSETGESHSQTTETTNIITGEVTKVVTNGLPGHLPAIERLDVVVPNQAIYQDGELVDFSRGTQRSDTEQIVVTMPFDFFLGCHVPREVVVEFPWAENAEELRQQIEALVQESAAMPVNFTLPANFIIREAQAIHLLYRPLLIDHNLRVKGVNWSWSGSQQIVTQVNCKLFGY